MLTYVFRSPKFGTHVCEKKPVGFDSFNRTFERSQKWHWVYPTYEQTLEFIEDGANYLYSAYEEDGIEAEVYMDTYKEDPQDLIRTILYSSKVKFNNYNRNHLGHVKIEVEQLSFAQQLKNNEQVKVDLTAPTAIEGNLPLPKLPYREITLHSKAILKISEMRHTGGADGVTFNRHVKKTDPFTEVYKKYTLLATNDKISEEIIESHTNPSQIGTDIPDFEPATPVMSRNTVFLFKENGYVNISYNLDFTFNVFWLGEMNATAYVVLRRITAAGVDEVLVKQHVASYGNQYFNIAPSGKHQSKTISIKKQVSKGLNVNIGDEIYAYIETEVSHRSHKVEEQIFNWDQYVATLNESDFHVYSYGISATAMTLTEGTLSQGIAFGDAFTRVIESLTGQVLSFDNSFYSLFDGYNSVDPTTDQQPGKRLLMSGIHARGWTFEEKPLVVTLADMYDTAFTLDCVGMGVKKVGDEYKAYVAPIEEFYTDEEVLNLGVVTNWNTKSDLDTTYNQVKIGYNKYDTDSTNSLDEFNGSRNWKTYINNHDNVYEAVSNFRFDGYGLETARRQGKQANPNKSTPYDKDTFGVCFMRAGGKIVSEDGSIFTEVSNLIDPPTAYNARVSPARIARKHEPLLASCLQKGLTSELRFTDGEVNTDMSSRIVGETQTIKEGASRKNNLLKKPLFLNEIYEFSIPLTDEQVSLLEFNPHGTITFLNEQGQRLAGFIQRAEIDYNNLGTFTLKRKYING